MRVLGQCSVPPLSSQRPHAQCILVSWSLPLLSYGCHMTIATHAIPHLPVMSPPNSCIVVHSTRGLPYKQLLAAVGVGAGPSVINVGVSSSSSLPLSSSSLSLSSSPSFVPDHRHHHPLPHPSHCLPLVVLRRCPRRCRLLPHRAPPSTLREVARGGGWGVPLWCGGVIVVPSPFHPTSSGSRQLLWWRRR